MAKPDLNLFVIFDSIMQEQSITAAADRLAMTQPSVSNAVARMRQSWKDPLFIKQGRGIKPTPFAIKLWRKIADPLNTISGAVAPAVFIPELAKRQFRIALTDGMTGMLWVPLRKLIEQEAPFIDIHAVPYKGDGEDLLLNADVDLVMDYYFGTSKFIHTKWMFDNHFVCVMRADHPLSHSPLTLHEFTRADHLFVSLSGEAKGIVDQVLQELGSSRRIAMTVNSFASTLSLLKETNLITVLPYRVVADAVECGDLIVRKPPLIVPPAKIFMAWHTRHNRDPGLEWLRNSLSRIIAEKQPLFNKILNEILTLS